MNEVRSADVECQSRISENASVFGPRWETLRCRAEAFYAVVGTPHEVETYKEHVRKANAATDESGKAADPPPGLRMPCDMGLFEELTSIKDLERCAKEVEDQATNPAELKVAMEEWQSKQSPYVRLLHLVTSAVSSFQKAKATMQTDVENRDKKDRAKADKDRKARAKAAAVGGQATVGLTAC